MNQPNLSILTPDSTLLFFLRTLFSTIAEYAVYIPDLGDVIILAKEQLVSLIDRGCADSMIKTLPQLIARNIVNSLNPYDFDYPEELNALYVSMTGSFIATLETALYPDEPVLPEWWEAPVPFAISSRGILRLNTTAKNLLGSELEKLNARELPNQDEFIITLENKFIAFKKLKSGIYSVDDCTNELNDAQNITWWAAVGQAWIKEIEAQGGKWQKLDNPPEGKSKTFRACEWQGELQGYLNIIMPARKKVSVNNTKKASAPSKESAPEKITPRKSDDVITNIGPQAMALLAAGQLREQENLL